MEKIKLKLLSILELLYMKLEKKHQKSTSTTKKTKTRKIRFAKGLPVVIRLKSKMEKVGKKNLWEKHAKDLYKYLGHQMKNKVKLLMLKIVLINLELKGDVYMMSSILWKVFKW